MGSSIEFGQLDTQNRNARTTGASATPTAGKNYIAAIGINHYRDRFWPQLNNAVNDAKGTLEAFQRLGFEQVAPPLYDEAATHEAMRRLFEHRLQQLGPNDSLVFYFAGHGYVDDRTEPGHLGYRTGPCVGYLIPSDGYEPDGSCDTSTWLEMESWLGRIARLRARHVLVIVDCCHSGMLLSPLARWRNDTQLAAPLQELSQRVSRRVFASTLPKDPANDSGRIPGHSPFTGYLIEALTSNLPGRISPEHLVLSWDVWTHIRQRFFEYNIQQISMMGAFEYHAEGDLVVALSMNKMESTLAVGAHAPAKPPEAVLRGTSSLIPPDPKMHASFKELDRQHQGRQHEVVISTLSAEQSIAVDTWAAWAAHQHVLAILTTQSTVDGAVADVLAQLPWTRVLPLAKNRFAMAAKLKLDELTAAFDSYSGLQRRRWIAAATTGNRAAHLAGWLLDRMRASGSCVPSLAEAPYRGLDLLSAFDELEIPIAVLFHQAAASEAWSRQALQTSVTLARALPHRACGVAIETHVLDRILVSSHAAWATLALRGRIELKDHVARPTGVRQRLEGRLFAALEADPRTRGRFRRDAQAPIHGPRQSCAVSILGNRIRMVIQIDDWRHAGVHSYAEERASDLALQDAGFFVLRFLPEDIQQRLDVVVSDIVDAMAARRAANSPWETFA